MSDALSTTPAIAFPEPMGRALPPLTLNASLRWDVVSRLLPSRPGAVLEVGCGRGAAAARIAPRADSLVGCEPDTDSFAVAKANIGTIASLYNCMSFDLPGAYRFDTICAFEVLEHIEDDAGALAEWFGKLQPGGALFLSVPAGQARFAAADRIAGHFRRYEPREMREKLERAGFTEIHVELYGFPAGHLLEAARNFVAARMLRRGAGDLDIAERTAGSGRLLQPGHGWSGVATAIAARPLVWLQRLFPNRGVGLIARARRPD